MNLEMESGRPSSKASYYYHQERLFARPPEAIWPLASDTARINEIAGRNPYTVEEKVDAQGRIRRYARSNAGVLRETWEEGYGEWQENRRLTMVRDFHAGPMRRLEVTIELAAEGDGCRMLFTVVGETSGLSGFLGRHLGLVDRGCGKIVAAIEKLVLQSDKPDETPGVSDQSLVAMPVRSRFQTLAAKLEADPASHGLAPKLIGFLEHAPMVSLRSIRPLALAKLWNAPTDHVVELFLAASQSGILIMGWDLLCPRCRGAKSRSGNLHELPEGAHCASCNIDYQRNFSSNVELTFHPQPWIRALSDGELCLLGPSTTPHVKLQAEVAGRSKSNFSLSLAPGPYRVRTIEASREADIEIGADRGIPAVVARGCDIFLEEGCGPDEVVIRNEGDLPLLFVLEDRNWAIDALTGEKVIAMPAFRRLCPEQLLRPGDNAEIGRVTIMFTDLVGSTRLYEALGDATAYSLVRDHFSFLSERVQRHGGFIVKTVGDAVMAAFSHSADAVQTAIAIQNEVASFNSRNGTDENNDPIVLKIGIHSGSCIAVTAGNVLDYFGATVNIAARLEHQCVGGEVIVSRAMLADSATGTALSGRTLREDSATLRGLSEPVQFVRVT